jgi:hypothetical protein
VNAKQFIEQVLLAEFSQIAATYHYISFSLIGLGTEFLGACLDNYDFGEQRLSALRFRSAVHALYPAAYHQYADLLAKSLRNGFAHQFRPGPSLELSKRSEAPSRGWNHLRPTKEGRVCLIAEDLHEDFAKACRSVTHGIDTGKLSHPKLGTTYLTT